MNNIIYELYNLVLKLISTMGDVWVWLNTERSFAIFGFTIFDNVSFLNMLFGGGIFVLLIIWIIRG